MTLGFGKPFFFSIEGIEGSGKTTQCAAVKTHLQALGLPISQSREPGGTPAGEAIRELILFGKADLSITAQVLLFFAARDQVIRDVIVPDMSAGKIVMTDRHTLSTVAYQGYGLANGDEKTLELIRGLDETMPAHPDITFWLDIPTSVSSKRIKARGEVTDRFESKENAFFERVRTGYLESWKRNKDRIVRIDGTLKQSDITKMILTGLAKKFLPSDIPLSPQ